VPQRQTSLRLADAESMCS